MAAERRNDAGSLLAIAGLSLAVGVPVYHAVRVGIERLAPVEHALPDLNGDGVPERGFRLGSLEWTLYSCPDGTYMRAR